MMLGTPKMGTGCWVLSRQRGVCWSYRLRRAGKRVAAASPGLAHGETR